MSMLVVHVFAHRNTGTSLDFLKVRFCGSPVGSRLRRSFLRLRSSKSLRRLGASLAQVLFCNQTDFAVDFPPLESYFAVCCFQFLSHVMAHGSRPQN